MKNSCKVLFLVQLPPPVHGSATISKLLADSALLQSKVELKVLPLRFAQSMTDLGSFSFAKLTRMFAFTFILVRAARSFKPDLVYFTISPTGISFYRDVLYVAVLKMMRSRIVYHLHVKGIKESSEKHTLKRWLYSFVFRNTYTISLSKYLADDLPFPSIRRKFIVNNGIATTAESAKLKRESVGSRRRLLYLSNLMRAKGIFILIQAAGILKKRKDNFLLDIVGKPADVTRAQIDQAVSENDLHDCVMIHEGKFGSDKYQAFIDADMFVHPTLNDAFPLVILEAMQFQLPVISTLEGAIPEIVDEGVTGFLVEKNDAISLASKIEHLIDHPAICLSMGKAGYEKFLSRYTVNLMERRLCNVLTEVCGN